MRYHTEVLGFIQAFRYGTYAGLKLGKCELHITLPGDSSPWSAAATPISLATQWTITLQRSGAGAMLRSEPGDRMYGMRDFVAPGPDGDQLSFGCDNEKE